MCCLYLSVFCQLGKSKICLVLFMGKHDTVKRYLGSLPSQHARDQSSVGSSFACQLKPPV